MQLDNVCSAMTPGWRQAWGIPSPNSNAEAESVGPRSHASPTTTADHQSLVLRIPGPIFRVDKHMFDKQNPAASGLESESANLWSVSEILLPEESVCVLTPGALRDHIPDRLLCGLRALST